VSLLAITGADCWLPGAAGLDALWQLLSSGQRATGPITAASLGAPLEPYFAAEAGVIDHTPSLELGDVPPPPAAGRPSSLDGLDLSVHLAFHVAQGALASAPPSRRPRTGLVLAGYTWAVFTAAQRIVERLYDPLLRDLLAASPIAAQGPDDRRNTALSGLVPDLLCSALQLGGPRLALDAACASTAYAFEVARHWLDAGRADEVVVVAVSASDPLFSLLGFAAVHALPAAGAVSQPLDADSAGICPSKGAIAFCLRRPQAVAKQGGPLLGLIRGIGLSNDGRGRSLLAPDTRGQAEAITLALQQARLEPSDLPVVECHATGTAAGDQSELDAIARVLGTRPRLGAAKSQLGHLLPAAAGVGLLKMLLSFAHRALPGTCGLRRPLTAQDGAAFDIPAVTTPWTPGAPLRAGVNAFGFGGANAHLIVEAPNAEVSAAAALTAPPALAIIGAAGCFGDSPTLAALQRRWRQGSVDHRPRPADRWFGLEGAFEALTGQPADAVAGAFLDELAVDALRSRLPPDGLPRHNPQQVALVGVSDAAVQQAGLTPGARVAVVVAHGVELRIHRLQARWELAHRLPADAPLAAIRDALHPPATVGDFTSWIGNLMASRVSALWDFHGPSLTVSADALSTEAALEVARGLLSDPGIDAVVVGAVDLCGGPEAVALRARLTPLRSRPAEALLDGGGWRPGEGAGAIVLCRTADAEARQQPILAELLALEACQGPPTAATVAEAAQAALLAAGLPAAAIGLVEARNEGSPHLDQAEREGLDAVYGAAGAVVGSAAHSLGHLGAAAGMASLLRALCALQGAVLLPGPGVAAPTRLCAPEAARPWFPDAGRVAAISAVGAQGGARHLLLRGPPMAPGLALASAGHPPARVLPVLISSPADLEGALRALLEATGSLERRSAQALAAVAQAPKGQGLVALVATDDPSLRREVEQARIAVPAALASGRPWVSAGGSRFSPAPVGATGEVCFVYPGLQALYPGAGRGLFSLAPATAEALCATMGGLQAAFAADALLPWTESPEAAEAAEEALLTDPLALLSAGVGLSTLWTELLGEGLGLQPDCALGFSLGEVTLLVALGVWAPEPALVRALAGSEVFSTALRPPHRGITGEGPLDWESWTLLADRAQVEALRVEGAGWSIDPAPGEVVIAGTAAGCQALIAALGCPAVPMATPIAVHAAPLRPLAPRLAPALEFATGQPKARLYAAAGPDGRMPQAPGALAQAVAEGVLSPLDFQAMLHRAWDDGARLFIEVGPGSTCTRWVHSVLGPKGARALCVDQRGKSVYHSLTLLLAGLLAERAPLRLDPWIASLEDAAPGAVPRRLPLGGPSIAAALQALRRPAPSPAPAPLAAAPTSNALAALVASGLRAAAAHRDMLEARARALRHLAGAPARPALFEQPALIAFAEGRAVDTFGPSWAAVDGYRRRLRVPAPPFMALSRVVALHGQPGRLEPHLEVRGQLCVGHIITEYDLPAPYWAAVDGQVPWLALDAQGVLFLAAWLGLDTLNRGERVFRWLDAHLVTDGPMPREGQTVRWDITIDRFLEDGDSLLFFSTYHGTCDGQPLMRIERCCAGFFTDATLSTGTGIQSRHRSTPPVGRPAPAFPPGPRQLDRAALVALSEGRGAEVLGPHLCSPANPALRLPVEKHLFLDRLLQVEPQGGRYGRGRLVAEKDLSVDDWYIRAHFVDDPVFAGPCMIEGAQQLLSLWLLLSGAGSGGAGLRFSPEVGQPLRVCFRGQVPGGPLPFRFDLHVVEHRNDPLPTVIADVDLLYDGRVQGIVERISLSLRASSP